MAVALADLPASSLADICLTRPSISTRPLRPSEYYPPGTSRTSTVRSGVDADRIYNATVGQRSYILQQLEEAERDARDALFALEMMEMELARETAAIRTALSHLSETLPPDEFEKMYEFAFGQSKKDWESVWKHEWVADSTERDRFTKCSSFRGPSKKPRSNPPPSLPAPRIPSSPLPPSSPPPPTSPVNSQNRLPPRTSPVRINGVPWDEYQWPTRQRSPTPPDGFRTPWGFVENFGSTRYRPTVPEPAVGPSRPQQSRRLKRDSRRLEMRQDGTCVIVDPQEDIEAQRREIREKMRLQAESRLPPEAMASLRRIVQPRVTDRAQGPPVTWFRVFEDKEPLLDDLTNPFAQDDHIPPTYQELFSRRPEHDSEDEQEYDSGGEQEYDSEGEQEYDSEDEQEHDLGDEQETDTEEDEQETDSEASHHVQGEQ